MGSDGKESSCNASLKKKVLNCTFEIQVTVCFSHYPVCMCVCMCTYEKF